MSVVECKTPDVVLTEELVPLLNVWLEKQWRFYLAEWGEMNAVGYTPLERLCFEAGMGDHQRTLYRILKRESAYVDLDTAERLMWAADIDPAEVVVYDRKEVNRAVMFQNELALTIARATGRYIPPAGKRTKQHIPALRRELIAA